jgi:hypothetical protein
VKRVRNAADAPRSGARSCATRSGSPAEKGRHMWTNPRSIPSRRSTTRNTTWSAR